MMYKGTKTVPRGSKSTEEWIVHLSEILEYGSLCKQKPAFSGLILSVIYYNSTSPLFSFRLVQFLAVIVVCSFALSFLCLLNSFLCNVKIFLIQFNTYKVAVKIHAGDSSCTAPQRKI